MRAIALISLSLLAFTTPLVSGGTPTKVVVRAVSRDAKIIGSGVGGAKITIRDASSGKILAEGMQSGGTGDTQKIIVQPRQRHETVYDTVGAAGYTATLDLDHPTVVEISAEGPLGHPQATMKASTTLLLIPGKDVLGEGVLLEIHGFIVELVEPKGDAPAQAGKPLDLRAKVVMACGCPTEPDGLWDSNQIQIVARLWKGGETVSQSNLTFANETSHYSGRLEVAEAGDYTLEILASDAGNANFGRFAKDLKVSP